jgi:hypothetical protein
VAAAGWVPDGQTLTLPAPSWRSFSAREEIGGQMKIGGTGPETGGPHSHEHLCPLCEKQFECACTVANSERFMIDEACAAARIFNGLSRTVRGDVAILAQSLGSYGGPTAIEVLAEAWQRERRTYARENAPGRIGPPASELRRLRKKEREAVARAYLQARRSGMEEVAAARKAARLCPDAFESVKDLKSYAHRLRNPKP